MKISGTLWKNRYGFIGFAILLTLITFQRSYFANYVLWDDDALIFNNIILKMPFVDAMKTAFTIYYHGDYFPLTLMSYWTDFQLFGMDPSMQHLVNLILQVCNVALLALFLSMLTPQFALVTFATLMFAIHPLQTESVMWISERKSLISGVFTFASLYFYLLSQKHKQWMWYSLALLTFIFACLAKATSVLLPILFIVLDFKEFGKNWKKLAIRFIPVGIVGFVLSQMRYAAYSASVSLVSDTMWNTRRLLHIPFMALNAIGFYIQKFFWPTHLSAMYGGYMPGTEIYVTSGIVAILLAFIGYRFWKTKNFYLMFFTLWFLLFLAPVLQIIPRINYVNDRYMYLPIIGFAGMVYYLFPWETWLLRLPSRYVKGVAVALLCLLCWTSFEQSQVWESNRALWEKAIQEFPDSAIAHNNLALDYQKYEEWDRAIPHYIMIIEKAQEESNKLLAFNNLANVYANPRFPKYDPNAAIGLLNEGLKRVTQLRESYELRTNLGILLFKQKRLKESRQVFGDILKDLDREPDYRFNWLRDLATKVVNSPDEVLDKFQINYGNH